MTYQFPHGFVWGASMSAYQTEGAWNEDGKGPSVWDDFCHQNGHIVDDSNGDVACDFYHRYEPDIVQMEKLGLKMVRFSVSWPRVIPDGVGKVNQKGLDFYIRLVRCFRDHGIEPVPVLFHWDLPSALMEKGGYASPYFSDWFVDYARIVLDALAPWISRVYTINQPYSVFKAVAGTVRAPASGNPQSAYLASLHCLEAHGKVVALVRKEYSSLKVGIILNLIPYEPAGNRSEDVLAARWQDTLTNKQFLLPLSGLGFPKELRNYVRQWGFDQLFFDERILQIISLPIDMIGVNYYQKMVVRGISPDGHHAEKVSAGRYPETDGGRAIAPEGLRTVLGWVRDLFPLADIWVTENGADYRSCGKCDQARISYLSLHLKTISDMIQEGFPIRGYLLWTLMDNFEWENGYRGKYGIWALGEHLERIPKQSAIWYASVIKANALTI